AGDATAAVLAGDKPTLAVARVAVGEIRGLAEHRDRAGLLLPFDDALVRNIAAEQIAPVAEPYRTLGPAQAGGQPLHGRQLEPVFFEARVECSNGWIGVIGRRPPALRRFLELGRCIVHVQSRYCVPSVQVCYHQLSTAANRSLNTRKD